MKYGDEALDLVGFPSIHKSGFVSVARSERSVIISRAVGKSAMSLIVEGHDSKGYRIHGKSCDWGPMAGFVLRDPRLSKKGKKGKVGQSKAHIEALYDTNKIGWKASTQQVYISNDRLKWLLENQDDYGREYLSNKAPSSQANQYLGIATPNDKSVRIEYSLRKTMAKGKVVWAIWYKTFGDKGAFKPMVGMVNPHPTYPAKDYRNVITGDYDLFAIWPEDKIYDPKVEDKRLGGMGSQMNNKQVIQLEDPQMGNITNRVHLIAQMLNSVLDAGKGKTGRNMIHHSDEGGRPFIDDVDLPLIGFLPYKNTVMVAGVENIADMKKFTVWCWVAGYSIILNAAWLNDLGGVANLGVEQEWGNAWGKSGTKYTWPGRNK